MVYYFRADKLFVSKYTWSQFDRIEVKAAPDQKEKLKKLSSPQIKHKRLDGEEIKKC